MNSFRFSCEAVLSVRQHELEAAEAELGQATAGVAELEQRVSLINDRRRAFQAERRSLQMGQQFDVSLAARADRVGDQLRLELVHAQQQLEDARHRLSEVREACGVARSALDSLEQLQERELAVWRQKTERALERETEDAWRSLH